MTTLRPLHISLGELWSVSLIPSRGLASKQSDTQEGIKIEIHPSVNGHSISRLSFKYRSSLHQYDLDLSEIVQEIEQQLRSEEITEEPATDDLLGYLHQALRTLKSPELASIAHSFQANYIAPQEQIVLDHFLTGLACYLTLYALLLEDSYQGELPFQFSLPYADLSIEVCTQNAYHYLMHILPSLSSLIEGEGNRTLDHLLIQRAIEFMNVWEWLFELGAECSETQAQNQTLSGYNEVLLRRMGRFLSLRENFDSFVEKKMKDALPTLLTQSSSLNATIQRTINQRCEEIAQHYVKHQFTLESRVSALEEFATSARCLFKELSSEQHHYQQRMETLWQELTTRLEALEQRKFPSF